MPAKVQADQNLATLAGMHVCPRCVISDPPQPCFLHGRVVSADQESPSTGRHARRAARTFDACSLGTPPPCCKMVSLHSAAHVARKTPLHRLQTTSNRHVLQTTHAAL